MKPRLTWSNWLHMWLCTSADGRRSYAGYTPWDAYKAWARTEIW